jgi:hypothetical protein
VSAFPGPIHYGTVGQKTPTNQSIASEFEEEVCVNKWPNQFLLIQQRLFQTKSSYFFLSSFIKSALRFNSFEWAATFLNRLSQTNIEDRVEDLL